MRPVARKRKEDAEKTRSRILASALSLFVKKGYEHTTFTDIAERLKMTKGAVYWHFETKEKLLIALIEIALKKFSRQIMELTPEGELSFMDVANMMVANAVKLVGDPRGAAFFKLMKCQLKWGDASMASVRENLLGSQPFSPKRAFQTALQNDIRAGRARQVNIEEISTVAISIWDGLVQAKLDHFLFCDLEATLCHSFKAIWNHIRIGGSEGNLVGKAIDNGNEQ